MPEPPPPLAPGLGSLDDAAIMERSARDPEMFAVLYDPHAAALHRYVARRLGEGAADDIVAETFVAAVILSTAFTQVTEVPAPGDG